MEPLLGTCDVRLGILNVVTLCIVAWGFFWFGVHCARAKANESARKDSRRDVDPAGSGLQADTASPVQDREGDLAPAAARQRDDPSPWNGAERRGRIVTH